MAPIIAFILLTTLSYISGACLRLKHRDRRDQLDGTLKLLKRLVRA